MQKMHQQRSINCRAVYFTELECSQELSVFLAAFAADYQHDKEQCCCLHWDQLSSEPESWKKMLKHQYKNEFLAATNKKYSALEHRNTFHHVHRTEIISKTLSLMWKFNYKFDTDRFLIKFKAWICAWGDLKESIQHDIYAATLAARVFRALVAITAAFDLEMFQWDMINMFVNSSMKEMIYCNCSENFEKTEKCLLLLQVLYELRTSSLLWLKELTKIL